MSRLAGTPRPEGGIPESVSLYSDWNDLKRERAAFDTVMLDWADRLDEASLAGELTWYSGAAKAEVRKPLWLLVTHMFNHQTHHRGQVHCMLTQAGGKPERHRLAVHADVTTRLPLSPSRLRGSEDRGWRARPCRTSKPNFCAGCGTSRSSAPMLRPGRMLHKTLLGEPVLIGRGRDGRVFALRDICPHRGIPLHYGRFDGETIACCYHGWRFDRAGACVEIPSLREGQEVDLGKIRCGPTLASSGKGLVWIYFPRAGPGGGSARAAGAAAHAGLLRRRRCPRPRSCSRFPARPITPPSGSWTRPMPASCIPRGGSSTRRPSCARRRSNSSRASSASAWCAIRCRRRTSSTSCSGQQRRDRDLLSAAGAAHRGGARRPPQPSSASPRSRRSRTRPRRCTRYSGRRRPGWRCSSPLIKPFMHTFLDQDRQVVVKQREGLVHKPRLMLINDADTQARWWMRVKDEWIAAQSRSGDRS